jgi:hypothetical protein
MVGLKEIDDPKADDTCHRGAGNKAVLRNGREHVQPRYLVVDGTGAKQRWVYCKACATPPVLQEIKKLERIKKQEQSNAGNSGITAGGVVVAVLVAVLAVAAVHGCGPSSPGRSGPTPSATVTRHAPSPTATHR